MPISLPVRLQTRRRQGIGALSIVLLLVLAALGLPPRPADAAKPSEPAATAVDQGVSEDLIEQERKAIKEAGGFTEEQQKQLLAQLDEARAWLQETEQLRTELARLQKVAADAPGKIERLRADPMPPAALPPALLDRLSRLELAELEAKYVELQNRRQRAVAQLAQREGDLTSFATLTKTGGSKIAELQREHDDLLRALKATDASQDNIALQRVQRLHHQAHARMLETKLHVLGFRQNNLGLFGELAEARRKALIAEAETLRQAMDRVRGAIQAGREQALRAAKDASRSTETDDTPESRAVREKTAEILDEHAELIGREARIAERLSAVRSQLAALEADRDWVQHVVEVAESGETVSRLLQKRRVALPQPSTLRKETHATREQLDAAVLRHLILDDEIKAHEKGLASQWSPEPARGTEAYPVATADPGALIELHKSYTRYIGALSELDVALRQLLQRVDSYSAFLNDELLWMPSTIPIPLGWPRAVLAGLEWLAAPTNLQHLWNDIRKVWTGHPGAILLWLLATLLPITLHNWATRGLKRSGNATRSVRTDSAAATWSALGYTAILASPGVIFFFGAAGLLRSSQTADEFTLAVIQGLGAAGTVLLLIGGTRQLCRANGLAVRHLRWSQALCRSLRRHFLWFLPLSLVLSFLTAAGSLPGTGESPMAMGRFAFLVLMAACAVFIHQVWRSNGPVLTELRGENENDAWVSFHGIWFTVALGIPIVLFISTLAGYYYTALLLVDRLYLSFWFWVGIRILRDMLLRGLNVSRRRLRFEEILRHRQESLAKRAAQPDPSAPPPSGGNVEQEVPDYVELSSQVSSVLRVAYLVVLIAGLWLVWASVLPALNFLDEITLPLTTTRMVDGISKDVPLTLGEVGLGLLLGALTLLLAKNAPGVLEFGLLQHLPLTRAGRYAIATLTQYAIAVLGIVIAVGALGLQWSNIQWLVAALSVGLGFGLQEVVANFVSGIILLFERPIRVGDVVTVNDISGTVSRIRIRATTILNWERQELVIPNKTFITGQLVNWTLSDTINRLIVTVGVAYGSDVPRALALMKEAAEEHPKVLDDPPPRVTFEAFGDNALTLLLRAYLDDMDARLPTTTDLHQAINDRFNAAGIVIAFPQRDVHLDLPGPVPVVMEPGTPGAAPGPGEPAPDGALRGPSSADNTDRT